MNAREREVRDRYRGKGWTMLRSGAPDFLAVRGSEVCGVEVKRPGDPLSPAQEQYRSAFQVAGVPYVIEIAEGQERMPRVWRRFPTRILTRVNRETCRAEVRYYHRVTPAGRFEELVSAPQLVHTARGIQILDQVKVIFSTGGP